MGRSGGVRKISPISGFFFYLYICYIFEEETSEVLRLEHSSVWC